MGVVPKISVIVPAYNAEATIDRCVRSILDQSFPNFELLMVNDGSKDETLSILRKCENEDERITVIDKNNEGVGKARNDALQVAKGDYVCFVDADDWVLPDYLLDLYNGMDDDVDLVIAYPRYCRPNNVEIPSYPEIKVNDSNFGTIFLQNNIDWHTAPWAKLFKRSVLQANDVYFPEDMKLGEDCIFLFNYMICSSGVKVLSATDYCYNAYSEGTLTKRKYDLDYEISLCSRIINSTDDLIAVKKITSGEQLKYLWRLKNTYIKRVLDSLYFTRDNTFKERISVLKSFDSGAYDNLMRCDTFQGNIMAFLLLHKFFRLYDFIRVMAKKIKR